MAISRFWGVIKDIHKYKYFWLIFAVAIILRIVKFQEYSMFGHDSSRDVILTYKMFSLGEIIYHGPVFSVVWGYMSPIYYYLLIPFHYIFNFHSLSSSIASNFINFLAVIFATFVSYKFFGRKCALVTAVVFGTCTLFIVNASSALNPSFAPIFVIGLYYFLARLIVDKNKKALIGLSVCLSFVLALHMSGVFFVPFLIIIFLIARPKTDIKTFLISVFLFGLLFVLPFLIQEKKLAWWTVKQFIKYYEDRDTRPTFTLIEKLSNFSNAVLRNTSLFLFGNIITGYIFYTIPFYLFMGFEFVKSVINYKKLTYHTLLVLLAGIYLITFMLTVPFDKEALNRLWFGACFMPLFGLYFSFLISKLLSKKFYYVGGIILAIFTFINILNVYNFNGSSDSYFHREEIANFIEKDSNGQTFDIYGENPEPLYYILWYNEKDLALKEKFRTSFVWSKNRGKENLFYVITNTPNFNITQLGAFTTQNEVYTTSLGYKIIKFTR